MISLPATYSEITRTLETLLISASNNYIHLAIVTVWYGDIYSINYYEVKEMEIPMNQIIMYHSINKTIEEARQVQTNRKDFVVQNNVDVTISIVSEVEKNPRVLDIVA